ncbi:MAG TPA: zf-HC2 domain-containing protein [Gemmatimonadales bacterium]|nr:zf-HC2 domain-containing protein [Gemmatimonadales bacterium]
MSDTWMERLSEYIDGTLPERERAALEEHVASCAECRTTLAELRRVVARAAALDDRPPTTNIWPGIAARIGVVSLDPRRARRRLSFTVPQLAAASVALVLLSGSAAWVLLRSGSVAPAATALMRTPTPVMMNAGTYESSPRYAAAVADLERTLARNRGRLDTTTVRVIEKNLAIINRAIRDAQSALAADPANSYLNLHLAHEMRRKLELLRQAATLTGARS